MYLWILFDVIVLAVFIICIVCASKKGFIRASYGIVSIILTMVLMLVFQDSITNAVKESAFGKNIETKIEQALLQNLSKSEEENTGEETEENKLGLPDFFNNLIVDKTEIIEETKNNIVSETAQSIAASIINIVSIIVLYFIIRLVLFLVLKSS